MILVHNIKWDEVDYDETDIEVIQQFNELPTDCLLDWKETNDEEVEDYLTDRFGWAVSTFDITLLDDNYTIIETIK